jgi:hypothetical protein
VAAKRTLTRLARVARGRAGGGGGQGASRHLVFMTYLNDVDDEGGTEFFHQKLVVQPRKGLTLVWPADWTFMHRCPSPSPPRAPPL